MILGCLQSLLALLTVLAVNGEVLDFSDGNTVELCYVCSCSFDRTSVDCSKRGLTDVPEGLSHEVKLLNISNNEISTFPKNLSRFVNLSLLDVSNNLVSILPADALYNLAELEILNISRNFFDQWINLNPNEAFLLTTKLKLLDLSFNKFKNMANLANQELIISKSLETLVLDHCEISTINGRSPLAGLLNVRVLKLNSNPLTQIHLISSTLRSLHVSNCQLSSLNNNELTYLPSLIYLKIDHNYRLEISSGINNLFSSSLKYLDISYCNILQLNLEGFPNLRKAIIDHNMIRYLRSREFINNTKLEYLDLSYNNIGSLKSDTLRGLTILKYLDLSWNEIALFPEDALMETPSLTQIKLSRNYITRVGHIRSMSIKTLDLSSCEINTIGKDSLEGLESLTDLNLSHNLLSHIPESISSNTIRYLNLNYNRLSSISNYTFFMLPRLTGLAVVGNRFTNIWSSSNFQSNPYLERLDLSDNMWRCDCKDPNMFDFYEFVSLEPSKKEETYNLICNSPASVIGQTWLEACYFTWNPAESSKSPDTVIWFLIVMIIGLSICFITVSAIKKSMKRRLATIQAERERQVEEARDRLRQLRIRAEQEALCNTPDPRDLIAPPSYDEALSMPKLNASCHSLCEAGTGRTKRKRGKRKTKSSGDLLDETERNGDIAMSDDLELSETPAENSRRRRRRRRSTKFGSNEIADLENSPGARRRRMSAIETPEETTTVEVEAELERPLRPRNRRYSSEDNEPRESDF